MEILKKVTELKAELDSLRPLDKEREAIVMQKLRLDWNYHSNHLEGNSLTFGETKALILFGITAAGKPLKDHFEMTGHDEAIKWVEEVVKGERPLTENFIRELHRLILKEPYEMPTVTPEGLPGKRIIHVGEYKSVPNHVLTVTGEIFRFAKPEETPALMHDLIQWYRQKKAEPDMHPLLLAAEFHYKFIRIHPFDDGNGRTARILMNFILMENGYPPVIIKTEDKANYIAALQQSDAGMIVPFIEYIGRNLERSLDIMIRGAKGENIDEADDVDKEIALIQQRLKSMEKEVKYIRSQEKIVSLHQYSFSKLIDNFITTCHKFDKNYQKHNLSIEINGNKVSSSIPDTQINRRIRERLLGNQVTEEIVLKYSFLSFNGKGIPYFDYEMSLYFIFDKNTYSICDKEGKKLIENYYHENLTEENIGKTIRAISQGHTNFINHQIDLAQKNKAI